MDEAKIPHLEMIQNIINRMNSNSFLLKGWSVTIFVGLFTFANIKDMDSRFIIIALIPTIIFLILDSFFLRQERLFRHLYDDVRLDNTHDFKFSMKTSKYKKKKDVSYIKVMLSITVWPCYLPIIIITFIIFFSNPKVTSYLSTLFNNLKILT